MKLLPKYFKENFSNRTASRTLKFLLAFDIIFVLLHALFIFLVFKRFDLGFSISPFMVNNDDGIPEFYQYIKFFVGIVLLIYLFVREKSIGYLAWILLFALMLLDDSLKFHEQFGDWVVKQFNVQPRFGLRAEDLGELSYVAIFGSILLLLLVGGFFMGNKTYKKITLDFGLLFAILLFFGIFIDMLHSFISYERYSDLILILVEDGGEMIALSLFIWYFVFLILKPEEHQRFLHEFCFKKPLIK